MTRFIRYQSAAPNRRGAFSGVFALANGLRNSGVLNTAESAWLEAANAHASAAYPDPSVQDPRCYDRVINPGARSWFKSDAIALLEMTAGYLALLDLHDVPWMELRTQTPGRIVYEDDVQVVAVPHAYPADWLLPPPP